MKEKEKEIQKLQKDLNDTKQKNLDLYKRINARDNIINKYKSKYTDFSIEKEMEKIKMNEKNGKSNSKEETETLEKIEYKEEIESLKNEIKKIKELLDTEKDNNKNKDKIIIKKEKEIRNIKNKFNAEPIINFDENKGIDNLENQKSNDEEMKKLRDQIENLEKEKNKNDLKLKEYEEQIKKLKYEFNQNELKLKEYEEQIKKLKYEFNQNELKLKEYEEHIKKLKYELNQNELKLKEYEEQIKKSKNEFNHNQNSIKCEVVHNGIKCQKCFQEPIIGYRYKCSVCNDYNLCQNCEEKNTVSEEHPHDFIKIRKNQDNSIINIEQYSYECINILQLSMYLYEGTEKGQCEIILKNNGAQAWPEGKTKLVFERESEICDNEIILRPQKPGEIGKYNIIVSGLGNYSHKQYKSYLCLYIDDEVIGDQIILTINIKEKDKPKKEIEDYMNKINEFREIYSLGVEDYSDEKLFEVLKNNNYDYDSAFGSLF